MNIPTDQQLGHRIESIVRTIAIAVAFVYAAGFTCGQMIHWLSANLTQLHTYLLKPTDGHSHPHPFIPAAHSRDRYGPSRSRQSEPESSRSSGVGFA